MRILGFINHNTNELLNIFTLNNCYTILVLSASTIWLPHQTYYIYCLHKIQNKFLTMSTFCYYVISSDFKSVIERRV